MAIKGKKLYGLYLDEENAEYVKSFADITDHGGLSGLVDKYISAIAKTLKSAKYVSGQNPTLKQTLNIFLKGIKAEGL